MFLLGNIAIIGVFGVPIEGSPIWFIALFLSKAIGLGAGYALYKLINYWSKSDLIPEFDKITKEEEDKWE